MDSRLNGPLSPDKALDSLCGLLRIAPAGLNDSGLFWAARITCHPDMTREVYNRALELGLFTKRIYLGANNRYYLDQRPEPAWERK